MTEFFEIVQSIADYFVYGLRMIGSLFTMSLDAFSYLSQTLILMPEYIRWTASLLLCVGVILFIVDRG